MKDISPESLAARDGNIQEGDVVLKVRKRLQRDTTRKFEVYHFIATQGHQQE